jgi:hypothetical protein
MERATQTGQRVSLESLRRHRAELRDSMSALEQALAAPAAGGFERWGDQVQAALSDLYADFLLHIEVTEGHDGLYGELLEEAPRLSEAVSRLISEHAAITGLLDDLVSGGTTPETDADVTAVRRLGTELLGRLVRHRQRGADLVYEAYEFDIGGDT